MKKIKTYQKPYVLNLGGRAASGQMVPMACIPGTTVTPITCFTGGNDALCDTGGVGITVVEDCRPGTSPDGATCGSGNLATSYECAGGSSPLYPGDCVVGPSN